MTMERSPKSPTFERVLETIGEFGLYQVRIYIILTLMDVSNSQCMLFYIFGNVSPSWTCLKYEGYDANLTTQSLMNLTFSNVSNASDPWRGRCTYRGAMCEAFKFHGNLKSIVTEWDLVCDRSYIPPLTSTLFFAGVLVGAFIFGQIADMFGRKRVTIVVSTMQMCCQILVGFTNLWQVYAFMRFMVGVFVGGSLLLCFTIPMEFIGPKWRTLCGALGVFGFGTMMLTLWAWVLPDWRHQAFVSGSVCLPLVLLIIIWVPESVRFLIQKGRYAEAEECIIKIARTNKKPVPDLSILKEIARINRENEEKESHYSYIDLFRTRANASRTLVMMAVWFSSSTLYYGINAQLVDLFGNMYVNTAVGAATSMPLSWTVIVVANWIGRKKAYLAYVAFPCVGLAIILVLAGTGDSESTPIVITALVLLCLSGANAAWALATTYSGELYATLIRNIAIGACSVSARVGGILAPQFAYLGQIIHWTVPYIIYAILTVGSTIGVLVALPETNGRPLPETVLEKKVPLEPMSQIALTSTPDTDSTSNGHGYPNKDYVPTSTEKV